jgi:hypothetical protein
MLSKILAVLAAASMSASIGARPSSAADTTKPPAGWEDIKDKDGNVQGIMDPIMSKYLHSTKPQPTQASLDQILQKVTRVRVIAGGENDGKALGKKVILNTTDEHAIGELRESLKVKDGPLGHDMCIGYPAIELYAGDLLIATLGMHHGVAIRWNEWNDDAALIDGHRLISWFSEHGIDEPRKELEQDEQLRTLLAKRWDRWHASLPTCLQDVDKQVVSGTSEVPQKITTAMDTAYPDVNERVRALCSWFGKGNGPWNAYAEYESWPAKMLTAVPTSEVIRALSDRELDASTLEGASRYIASWEFWSKHCGDEKLIPEELKKRLLMHLTASGDKTKVSVFKSAFKRKCL